MKPLSFEIPGEPRGWARARTGGGKFFTDSKTRSEKATVAWWAKKAGAVIADGPLQLTIIAYQGIPKSASKKRRAAMLSGAERPTKKPDSDNLAKLTMDALNKVVWRDDTQVVDLTVRKFWSDEPRIQIYISPASLAGITAQTRGGDQNRAAQAA